MPTPRPENRADVTIDGVAYQVVPGEGNFLKSTVRTLLQEQNLAADGATTRSDMRPVFQTSWADGSRWERPLLSEVNITSYNISEGFDVISQPGDLYALPDVTTIAAATINDNPEALQVSPTITYYFERQAANLGLVQWNGSSFSTLTNDFGEGAAAIPQSMCWDRARSTVFATFNEPAVDASVRFVTPDSAGGAVISITASFPGANLFMWDGRLLTYNGVELREITDPLGSPALSSVFDDGMGRDWLNNIVSNTTDPILPEHWGMKLAIATAEGVFIVKNVVQQGLVTPFIYRIERTSDGQDIGTPVATLPPGTVCLNIAWHLGSLVMACSTDVQRVMLNDISANGHAETIFYQLNLKSGLGTIGSPLGPAHGPVAIETVARFLGTHGNLLYIGGFDRIWAYDAVRGGLHPLINNNVSAAFGSWGSMVNTSDGTDNAFQFFHDDSPGLTLPRIDEAGNTMTHQLDSNYFDGGLPAEQKTIVAVTLMTDGTQANETWTVTFSADDAAFGSAATFATDNDTTVRVNLSTPLNGFRFRYRLAYTASADVSTPSSIKGIVVWMVQGEFLQQWRIKLRLADSINIRNAVIRGETQQTNLETLSTNQSIVAFIDAYRRTAATTQIRVQSAVIDKTSPLEGVMDVVLIEHSNS